MCSGEHNLDFIRLFAYIHFVFPCLTRLIKHTKQLLEENEERLCIKVLQTLREMMTKDRGYGEKVCTFCVFSCRVQPSPTLTVR